MAKAQPTTTKKTAKKKATTKKAATKKKTTKKKGSRSGASVQKPEDSKPVEESKRPPKKTDIVYPEITVSIFDDKSPLDLATAKELLGWQEESENVKFGKTYLFKMPISGAKVRCNHNVTNRIFYPNVAQDWMLEILRRKWKLNGESMIVDRLGYCQDCQHRLVGLAWAVEAWQKDPAKWHQFWGDTEPYMTGILVTGIVEDDDTINTIGTGKPRSITDVVYRSPYFSDMGVRDRKRASRVLANSVDLLWHRTSAADDSFAPRRPHSETLDFIARHERLLECSHHIYSERESLKKLVTLGYSAGLLYLMGCSNSNLDEYIKTGDESNLDWKHWDKACDYWVLISQQADKVKAVIGALTTGDAPLLAGGLKRAYVNATLINGWLAFVRNKPITAKVTPKLIEDADGVPQLKETPSCGGIDTAPA